jgi:hypothetical protein
VRLHLYLGFRAAGCLVRIATTAGDFDAGAGIAEHVRAAWCGHTKAVNADVYTHAQQQDLVTAGTAIFGAA